MTGGERLVSVSPNGLLSSYAQVEEALTVRLSNKHAKISIFECDMMTSEMILSVVVN